MKVRVRVRVNTRGKGHLPQEFMLTVHKLQTIGEVRRMMEGVLKCNRQLVLLCAGNKLKNKHTLEHYNISQDEEHPDTITVVVTQIRIISGRTKMDTHDRPHLDNGADVSMDSGDDENECEMAEVWWEKYDRSQEKQEKKDRSRKKEYYKQH